MVRASRFAARAAPARPVSGSSTTKTLALRCVTESARRVHLSRSFAIVPSAGVGLGRSSGGGVSSTEPTSIESRCPESLACVHSRRSCSRKSRRFPGRTRPRRERSSCCRPRTIAPRRVMLVVSHSTAQLDQWRLGLGADPAARAVWLAHTSCELVGASVARRACWRGRAAVRPGDAAVVVVALAIREETRERSRGQPPSPARNALTSAATSVGYWNRKPCAESG
jgi:hypothetical protein